METQVTNKILTARKASLKYQRSERGRLVSSTYRASRKAERAAYHRTYAESAQGRARILWGSARARAKERGLNFSLSVTQIIEALDAGYCQATDIAFSFEKPPAGCRVNPWAPAVDRKDNNKGYEESNVQVVCNAYNLAKNDFPDHVMQTLARAIIQKGSESGT